jgi:outer membrane immunogenic protein
MTKFNFMTTALAGAASLAFAAPAMAQPASDTVDWSGVYIGANAGWHQTDTNVTRGFAVTHTTVPANPVDTFPTANADYSTSSSWAAGGQVGLNKQVGHFVFGVEGDMDAVGGRGQQFSSYLLTAPPSPGGRVTIEHATRPDWTSTVRARAGYAMGPVLFYGTGGLAIAQIRQGTFFNYSGATDPTATAAGPFQNVAIRDGIRTGWVAGGGIEYAVNPRLSIGAEYRHSDYGHAPNFVGDGAPGASSENNNVGVTDDQALLKINYKIGAWSF